jgi:hypothetical protein
MTDYPLGMLQKSDGIHVAVFATSAYVAKEKNIKKVNPRCERKRLHRCLTSSKVSPQATDG